VLGDVLAREHQFALRVVLRPTGVEVGDLGVGVGRPQQAHLQAPRRRDVVDVLGPSREDAMVLDALEARPREPAVGGLGFAVGVRGRGGIRLGSRARHQSSSVSAGGTSAASFSAADSTAS